MTTTENRLRQGYIPAYPGGPLTPVVLEVQPDGTEKPCGGGRLLNTPSGQVRADPDGPFASMQVRRAGVERRSWRSRWQWSVTDFELVEDQHPGVFDRWMHLGAMGGHAPTRWWAYLDAGVYITAVKYGDSMRSESGFWHGVRHPLRVMGGWFR